jgi:serpin B
MKWTIALLCIALAGIRPAGALAGDAKADRIALVKGNTQFALELYAKLRTQDGNLFLSPYSISTALSMTYAGARRKTADEMAETLHFDLAPRDLHRAMGALIKQVNGDGDKKRGYQLITANALWGQKDYPFNPDFLKLNKDDYGAGMKEVDFIGNTEAARQTINAWVEKETRDKIKELFKPGILDRDSRLVLTNAIYFKGDWASRFKKDRTRDFHFHMSASKIVKAPLMNQTGDFKYHDAGTFQILEMPYVGKEVTMVVLLPKKVDGLADLEKNLTADNLAGWLGKLGTQEVQVTLPKFNVTAEFSLKETLAAMGMPTAFSDRADFTGIATKEGLFISAVVHKAFVDVNEEGTEAAAATGVGVSTLSARIIPEFKADHPFLFLIRDTRSGSILFLGRLVEPK